MRHQFYLKCSRFTVSGRMSSALIAMNICFPTMSSFLRTAFIHSKNLVTNYCRRDSFEHLKTSITIQTSHLVWLWIVLFIINCCTQTFQSQYNHKSHHSFGRTTDFTQPITKVRQWPAWAWYTHGFCFLDNSWSTKSISTPCRCTNYF